MHVYICVYADTDPFIEYCAIQCPAYNVHVLPNCAYVRVCMHVCAYVCERETEESMYMRLCVYTCVRVYACIGVYVYVCMHACIKTLYVYVSIVHIQTCVYTLYVLIVLTFVTNIHCMLSSYLFL
jgi:hypothetical protein